MIELHLGFHELDSYTKDKLEKQSGAYYRLNHKHEKKVKKDELYVIHAMTEKEAIENHVNKITKKILKSLNIPN